MARALADFADALPVLAALVLIGVGIFLVLYALWWLWR